MLIFGIVVHLIPTQLVSIFSKDPAVIEVGVGYLLVVSYTFVATVFVQLTLSMLMLRREFGRRLNFPVLDEEGGGLPIEDRAPAAIAAAAD